MGSVFVDRSSIKTGLAEVTTDCASAGDTGWGSTSGPEHTGFLFEYVKETRENQVLFQLCFRSRTVVTKITRCSVLLR